MRRVPRNISGSPEVSHSANGESGGGDRHYPFPRQDGSNVLRAKHEEGKMRGSPKPGIGSRGSNWLSGIGGTTSHRIRVAANLVRHNSTTQNPRDKRPARLKRSGEQDKDKQIDGGRTNGSFLIQNFLKKKFLPVNSQFR
jgi:hypothetical protein